MGLESDGAERDGAKGHRPDATWGGRVASVEFSDLLRGIVYILRILPCVPFHTITFPLYQILEPPSKHPAIQDLLYYVLFFAVNEQLVATIYILYLGQLLWAAWFNYRE